jgi:hypothetical protein
LSASEEAHEQRAERAEQRAEEGHGERLGDGSIDVVVLAGGHVLPVEDGSEQTQHAVGALEQAAEVEEPHRPEQIQEGEDPWRPTQRRLAGEGTRPDAAPEPRRPVPA